MKTVQADKMHWEIEVPICKNPVIIRQLAFALGGPFGIVAMIVLAVSWCEITGRYALYALGLLGALFSLTYLLIRLVYGGNYAAGFILDEQGILNYTQEKQAKRNKVINGLTIFLGLFSGKPAAAGAGLLAQSREVVLVRWSKIKKVTYYPRSYTILVRGGFAENIAVFCTPENYQMVQEKIRAKVGRIMGNKGKT